MKEKKNKSPKDIEKRKAKIKKIIFFILHGISYILSIMFIGALVIGGCSQKANTYKSANASYVNEKLTDIDSISVTNINAYKYQLNSSDVALNIPSINVIKSYFNFEDSFEIDINYNNLNSKSGENVFTRLYFSSNSIGFNGEKVGDNSILPTRFSCTLFDVIDGEYIYTPVLQDLVNHTFTRDIPLDYICSEFFDGTISILNYSSLSFTLDNVSSDNVKALKFLCFYLSQYSLLVANTRINNNISYYINLGLYPLGYTNGMLGYVYDRSFDNVTYEFIVGNFTYGGLKYDSFLIEYQAFNNVYKYFNNGGNVVEGQNLIVTANVVFIKRVSFVNSFNNDSFDFISPVLTNNNGVYTIGGYTYHINPSYQLVRFHTLANYIDTNINYSFNLNGTTRNKFVMRNNIFTILNYTEDYSGSTGENLINVFDLISRGFAGLGGILGIAILPSLTIGTLLAIPLVMVLVMFIIKLFKR